MFGKIVKGVLGVTIVGGVAALCYCGIKSILDDVKDVLAEDFDDIPEKETDDKTENVETEPKRDFKETKRVILPTDNDQRPYWPRPDRMDNMVCHYGCPNSKRVSKLLLNKKKG